MLPASPSPKRTKFDNSDESASEQNQKSLPSHGKSYERVTKEDLYMIIALWMEDFVEPDEPDPESMIKPNEEEQPSHNKVGAVLVLPNDIIYAADCSRDGVHAVQRLLMKHYDKAKGCKMFMSRKPCPVCAKLLVQAKVERVLFLPFEPEYYPSDDDGAKRDQVDNMFTASAIAQTRYVLHITNAIIKDARKRTPLKDKRTETQINDEKKRLDKKYELNSEWKNHIQKKLPWPAFDTEIDAQVQQFFDNTMTWMARVRVLFGCGLKYKFEVAKIQDKKPEITFEKVPEEEKEDKPDRIPDFLKNAEYFITIARLLSQRTDDPKAGVGAVIVSPELEILALGWNGFPLKALYGEFPRAPESDATTSEKKAPYIIHAEQNALLMRNEKNIKGSILFVSGRPPCNECAPLIAMQGVKTVVLDTDEDCDVNKMMRKKNEYKLFPKMVNKGKFDCYRTVKKQ